MIYYFIYETTNLINDKKYIGVHKTTDINDGYLGSGIAFKRALKKYGKENFNRIIIQFFDSYEETLAKEKQLVTKEWIEEKTNYNLKEGGYGGILSKESRNRISETLKLKYDNGELNKDTGIEKYQPTEEDIKKRSNSLKERYKTFKHNRIGEVPWNKGLKVGPQSEEVKKKKSDSLKERYKTEEHNRTGKEPWNKGKKGVQVAWIKGKTRDKVPCPHCEKEVDLVVGKRWHFDNCKHKQN